MSGPSPTDRVRAYHERSKHLPGRSAAGPHGLDWANKPEPFRTWGDVQTVELPLAGAGLATLYDDCLRPGAVAARPVDLASVAVLFELSLGLAAWKSIGPERWALRCNPSSGNLHPAEGYLVCPDVGGLAGGVYHYVSSQHVLELRARPDPEAWSRAWQDVATVGGEGPAQGQAPGLLVGLSSIHWREAWKYGERAYRYCQLDAGHAVGAISYAAAALGWQARMLEGWSDDSISALLGLPGDEAKAAPESPDLLLWVGPELATPPDTALLAGLDQATWEGEPNLLSPRRRDWDAIPEVIDACRFSGESLAPPGGDPWRPPELPPLAPTVEMAAARLIRQRRSAQAFDGVTRMAATDFYRMLDATLPRTDVPPLAPFGWEPRVHLLLFVHRVDDVAPGLYLLPRRPGVVTALRSVLDPEHSFEPVRDAPDHLPLRRLQSDDLRDLAAALSCRQDIAGDSAFSLGMLAELEDGLSRGAWWYRRLYWEAGAVGQALYLDAEAVGLRGTGIGCFFDDAVHQLLGLADARFQSLYHFTVGGAIKDRRLATHPPYAHLERPTTF